MSGSTGYLIDTNIIIYYLNGDEIAIDWLTEHKNRLSISIISSMKVLYHIHLQNRKMKLLKAF